MAKIPRDRSGRQVVAARQQIGFYVVHPRGSHLILRCDEPAATVSVPDHRRIRIGTLGNILHQTALDIHAFVELL